MSEFRFEIHMQKICFIGDLYIYQISSYYWLSTLDEREDNVNYKACSSYLGFLVLLIFSRDKKLFLLTLTISS